MKNNIGLLVASSALIGSFFIAGTAFAAGPGMHGAPGANKPGVFGTVSAINGTTLTVTSKFGLKDSGDNKTTTTTTTYTVNAANATVTKGNASSSVASIAVGDTVAVQGTVSGTSVTATTIRDLPAGQAGGVGMMGRGQGMKNGGDASSTPSIIQGNGQPVIGGNVTAVSGNTLTVTTAKGGVIYTVNAAGATIEKGGIASSIANIAVGDNVIVQGAVSGTSVTASSIVDSAPHTANATSTPGSEPKGFMGGMMGAVGGFFQRLFGFI